MVVCDRDQGCTGPIGGGGCTSLWGNQINYMQ